MEEFTGWTAASVTSAKKKLLKRKTNEKANHKMGTLGGTAILPLSRRLSLRSAAFARTCPGGESKKNRRFSWGVD